MKRGLSIILILAMLVTVMPQMYLPITEVKASGTEQAEPIAWQMDTYGGFVSDGNEITKYYVDSGDGGFYILPGEAVLDAQKKASYGLFEIDGQEYRFGQNYEGCNTEFSAPYLNEEGTTQATWRIFDYEITQMLTLKKADQADDSYGVAVVYQILNRGAETVSLRTQIVMDTSFGYFDDQPIVLNNQSGYVTNECMFSGDSVPESYQVDASSGAAPYTYGLFMGASLTTPESVIFGHFSNLSEGGYHYEPNSVLDFTVANNDFGSNDSAVVLTYDVGDIAPDTERDVATIYGFAGEYQPETEEVETETATTMETEVATEVVTEAGTGTESETQISEDAEEIEEKAAAAAKSESASTRASAVQGEPGDGVNIEAFIEEYKGENKAILFGAGDQISRISGTWTESTGERETATPGGYLDVEHNYNSNIPWTLVGEYAAGRLVMTTARLDFAHTYNDFSTGVSEMADLSALRSSAYAFLGDDDTGFLKDFSTAEQDALANVKVTDYRGYRRLQAGSNQFAMDFHTSTPAYKVYLPQATIFPLPSLYGEGTEYTYSFEYNGDPREEDRHVRYVTATMSSEIALFQTYEQNQRPFGKEAGRDFGRLNPDDVTYILSDVYADNKYPTTSDMEDRDLMERSMVSYKNNPQGTDVIAISHPNTLNFITPVVNLKYENILMISELVESGGDGVKTINRDEVDGDYTDFEDTAVLTIMESFSNEIGTIAIPGLADSSKDIIREGLQIDNVSVSLPSGADESKYRLVYKAVRENVQGQREIAAWGSSEDLTKLTIPSTNLEKDVSYDVYVWLETTKNHYATRIATKPIHFTGLCKSDDYAVEVVIGNGCKRASKNFRVTNAVDEDFATFAADQTVYVKGLGVDNVNRTALHVKVTERDSNLNVPVTYDKENDCYFFTMPEASLKIEVSAVDKAARFVTAEVVGAGKDEVKELTVSKDKVYTTDLVNIKTVLKSKLYYLSYIEVYEKIIDPITLEETERPLMLFESGASNRKDYEETSNCGEFDFKVPESDGDIIVRVTTGKIPNATVVFDVSGLKNTEIGISRNNVVRDGDTYVCSDFLIGFYSYCTIRSKTDYMALEVGEITKSDPAMADVSYSRRYQSSEGSPAFQCDVTMFIQPFDKDNWVDGTYTIVLKEKQMYRPYTIKDVTTDESVIDKVKKITIEGELLGQLLGKDGVDLLSKPEDIAATKKVLLQNGGRKEQIELSLSKAKLSSDSRKLEIPVTAEVQKKMQEWKNTDYPTTNYYIETKRNVTSFKVYNDAKYRPEPYGLLGVTQDAKGMHSIIMADTESELNQNAKGNEIILTLKGAVSYNQKKQQYMFNDEKTLMNGALTYQAAKDTDVLYVDEAGGTITIHAASGTLAAPGMILCNGNTAKGFAMEIKNGVTYKTSGYIEETAKTKNLRINWKQDKVLNKLAVMSGMYAYIDGVILLKGGLSYSGKLNLKMPTMDDPFLEAEMQELRMKLEGGNWKAAGAIAQGTANIGKDSIPGITFDASASAKVDTFKRVYEFETSLDFNIFEFEGTLKLAPIKSGALIPDTIDLFLATEAGLTLLPPQIIVLNGVGGGFSGLADTLDKNYQTLPPIMANIKGRLSFFKILTLDSQINAGPTEVSVSGKPKLGISEDLSIEIFDNMKAGIYMSADSFSFKAEVSASVVKNAQFLKGEGSLTAGYHFKKKKMTFSGRLYVKLQIPGFKIGIIKIGPITLKEIDMGVSDKEVYGKFKILWFKLGARYQWGKKKLSISRRSSAGSAEVNEHLVEICDESGVVVGVAEIGSNVRTISSSEDQSGKKARTTRAISEYVLTDIQENSLITLKAPKSDTPLTEVLEVSYSTDGENYTPYPLFYPRAEISDDENPYLEEELDDVQANALYSADVDADNNEIETIAVTPDYTLGSSWKISLKDNRALAYEHVCIDPLEELTAFTNTESDVTFTAENLKPNTAYSVAIYMTQNYADDSLETPSMLLDTIDISTTDNTEVTQTVSINITNMVSDLPSGEYQVYGVLQGEMAPIEGAVDAVTGRSGTESSTVSMSFANDPTGGVTYINDNKPEMVSNVQAEAIGSETVRLSFQDWQNDLSDTMYEVRVYENGEPVSKDGVPLVYQISEATAESVEERQYTAILSGLDPEKTYSFGVRAYQEQEVDTSEMFPNGRMTLSSEEAESNEVYIERATYPLIDVTADGADVSEGAEGVLTVTSTGIYTAQVSADQACIFEVSVDGQDAPVYLSADYETSADIPMQHSEEESFGQVTIKATNQSGDGSNISYIAVVDNTAPALFVEHQDGVVSADAKGNFLITGGTEGGANVAISGESSGAISADAEGRFTIQGKIATESEYIKVSSRDRAGNVSDEMVQVVRGEEELIFHTVTASAGEGGMISPEGNVMVADGMSATFSISAEDGYEVADVQIDAASVGVTELYTFDNVKADHSIHVSFKKLPQEEPGDPDDGDGDNGGGNDDDGDNDGGGDDGGDTSNKKETPKTPTKTTGTKVTTIQKISSAVKAGDYNNVVGWGIVFLVSLGVVGILYKRKRRNSN